MCRLAYLPNALMRDVAGDVSVRRMLVEFLDVLEAENGGHGNGFGAWTGGGFVVVKDLASNEEVFRRFLSRVGGRLVNGALYHTRLATHGRVSADNAHPFAAPEEGEPVLVLVHNGVWGFAREAAGELGIEWCGGLGWVWRGYGWYVDGRGSYGERGCVDKPDSWVMAQWLARRVAEAGAEEAIMELYATLGSDAVIVQVRGGDVYVVAGKPVQVGTYRGEYIVASSSLEVLEPAGVEVVGWLRGVARVRGGALEVLEGEVCEGWGGWWVVEGVAETCGVGRGVGRDVTRVRMRGRRGRGHG